MSEKTIKKQLREQIDAGNTQQVVEKLYLQDLSSSEISQKTGLDDLTIQNHIKTILEEIQKPRNLDEEKAKELRKLDYLLAHWYPIAVDAELKMSKECKDGNKILKKDVYNSGIRAAVYVLKILERRGRLMGMPIGPAPVNSFSKIDSEIPIEELEKQLTDEDREALKGCFYE